MKNGFSVLVFWIIISLLIAAVMVFYYLPADSKLVKLKQMFDNTEKKMMVIEKSKETLENELIAMEDPFNIERLLRSEYNYQPKQKTNRLTAEVGNTTIEPK